MTAYDTAVLADSPTDFYKTDETSGTSFADSGSGSHAGTLTGSHATLNTTIFAQKGVEFTADDTWISAAIGSIAVAGSWECIMHVYSDTGNIALVGYNTSGDNTPSDTGARCVGSLFGAAVGDAEGVGPGGGTTLSAGNDYHLVLTVASSGSNNLKLYVNGSLNVQATYVPGTATGGALYFPQGAFDTGVPHVAIGKVAYWDGTALTGTQVSNHYAAVSTGAGTAASGSGSLSLGASGTASVPVAAAASGSLSLGATGAASAVRGSAALSLGALWSGPAGASGSLDLLAFWTIPPTILDASGTGVLSEDAGTALGAPEFAMSILDTEIRRAPSSITVTVDGGRPGVEIQFFMDLTGGGQDLAYTTSLNTEGHLEPTSLTITGDLGGQQGSRILSAVQVAIDGGTLMSSIGYEVLLTPQPSLLVIGGDEDPVAIPGALDAAGVYHFVFQDLLGVMDGGIGSYVFPINPRQMSSPHLELALKTHHTTSQDGVFHVFQAGGVPLEWTLTGVADTQEFVEALEAYRALNRRIWIIDHRNRAWKSVIVNVDIVPRLRTNWNGELTDWMTDFTITAVIVDQNWSTPV